MKIIQMLLATIIIFFPVFSHAQNGSSTDLLIDIPPGALKYYKEAGLVPDHYQATDKISDEMKKLHPALRDNQGFSYQPQSYRVESFRTTDKNYSEFYNITLPNGLSSSKANEINSLLMKLNGLCPECAGGGTVGGGPVVGSNVNTGGGPAWGGVRTFPILGNCSTGDCVSIPRSEYNTLKDKAKKYDLLK